MEEVQHEGTGGGSEQIGLGGIGRAHNQELNRRSSDKFGEEDKGRHGKGRPDENY